ncbi:MAG: DUF4197 domain-containing protein [Flavobacteriales bacterium]|nr:DUF4197 domain-containing protein [Flavobacteriales bacterium]MCB9164778.1 DUF4197 domain-containing protein [Flavobacteriales bacterium]HPF89296.1 DUF4197 domain-containing protein [Flavobacteriales bacterium]
MKKTAAALLLVCLFSCSPQDMQNVLNSLPSNTALSNEEVISGLKEALRLGTERSVEKASVVDGFWNDARIRIPFPAEAMKVKNTLMDLGIKKPVEDFEHTMNKAAEEAAKEAVPVFVDAITNMSIQDGFNLLRGGENAATNFLREKTSEALRAKFTPVVEKATQQVALTSYWTPVANAYNTASLLTGGKAVDPDLNAYVTTKAMDGLFLLLADEEKKIRQDPAARATALLQKVFAQQ